MLRALSIAICFVLTWFGAMAQCVVDAGLPQTVCSGQQITLGGAPTAVGGSGNYTYVWTGQSGIPSIPNPVVTIQSTTTFTVTVTDDAGCTQSASVTVNVTPIPVVNAGPNLTRCLNSPSFSLPNPGGGIWSGAPASMLTPVGWFTPNSVGTYILTLSVTQNGCTGTAQVQVTVLPLPVTDAGPDQTICQGQSVQLAASASSPNGPITLYSWSGGTVTPHLSPNPTATPSSTTTYNLTAVDAAGCSSPDQVTVFVQPLPSVNAGPTLTLCNDPVPTTLTGFTPSGGTWSGTGVTPAGVFTPPGTGTFTLSYTVTSPAGCTTVATRTITVVAPGIVDAGPDVNVCLNTAPVNLSPVNPGGTWGGSPLVSTSGVFTPSMVGTYTLTYTLSTGSCISTDQVVVTVKPLPTVSANANQTICQGQTVTLSASASSLNGGISSYSWMGGVVSSPSQSSTQASPSATTVYSVSVIDAAGCSTQAQTTVNVNPMPVVSAGPDQQFCNNPVPEVLSGFSPAGGTWSGPGVSGAGVFTPSGLGTFVLTYSFTSAAGCSGSSQKTIVVIDGAPVNAGPDFSQCIAQGNFLLSGNTSSTGIWSGPGITNSGTGEVNVAQAGAGTHSYTITNGTGSCQYTDQISVTLFATPTVAAGLTQQVCSGSGSIQLVGASPVGGTWTGAQISDPLGGQFNSNVQPGNYVVVYFWSDPVSGCGASAQKTITVNPVPLADFSVPAFICTGNDFTPQNNSTGASGYLWNLGDESPEQNAMVPTHQFSASGVFNVTLIASNQFGCTSDATQEVISVESPQANFQMNHTQGCAPLVVEFVNQSSGDNLTYLWDFGDSQSAEFDPPPVVFIEIDGVTNYPIELTVSNQCGSNSTLQNLTVLPRPTAAFSETIVSTICSPVEVTFSNQSIGNPENFYWNFGNGESSLESTPEPTIFTTDGQPTSYEIWLVVENNCGADSVSQSVTVFPNQVTASFVLDENVGCAPMTLGLTNTSSGATTFNWQIQGVFNSQEVEPNVVLEDPGLYTLHLFATDGCGSNTAQASVEILVSPQAEISTNSWQTCEGAMVQYSAVAAGASTYTWLLGDGQTATGPIISYSYTAQNTYEVVLNVTAPNSCTASATEQMTVHPRPTASFGSSLSEGCSPVEVCLTNNSMGAVAYSWALSDGQGSSEVEPCLWLLAEGVENQIIVNLEVTNEYACSDAIQQIVTVHPVPSAQFNLVGAGTCTAPYDLPLEYQGNPTDQVEWSVNGQVVSNSAISVAALSVPETYSIGLNVTSEFGCSQQQNATFTIYASPLVAFEVDMDRGCVPHEVQFFNESQGAVAYIWQFGNGGISALNDPEVEYSESGVYSVSLTAISQDGCSSSVTQPNLIEVFALPIASFVPSVSQTSIYTPLVQFENTSEDAAFFEWNFGGLGVSQQINPVFEFTIPGNWPVTLTAISEEGCSHRFTETIRINSDLMVYVPNAFTPDGDGLNDVFIPEMASRESLRKYEMWIYDRWGNMVFYTANPSEAWIGNVRGGDYYAQPDTYWYRIVLEGTENSDAGILEGMVTLLR